MFLLLSFALTNLYAQNEERLWEQLSKSTKSEAFNIGAILQSVYSFQNNANGDDYNSFNIETSRLRIYGNLDKGFSYFFQYNLSKQFPLLDATFSYKFKPYLGIKIGSFKSPFSREYLTAVSGIDFVNRSQVVNALAPKRQIGMSLFGWISPNVLKYQVGMFNGNGVTPNANDNSKLMTVGRVSFYPNIIPFFNHFEIGANVGYNDASKKTTAPTVYTRNAFMGIDFRMQSTKVLLAGEIIRSQVSNANDNTNNASGFQLTFGYTLSQHTKMLARMDNFTPYGSNDSNDLIVLGVNFNPSSAAGFQLNYIIPSRDNNGQSVLINFQFVI